MQARLDEVRKLACTRLVVDFQDVTAIGSMGVSFIVAVWKSVVRRPGGRFVLTGVNPRVRLVLDLTRIGTVIPLAPDLASGLAILGVEAAAAPLTQADCALPAREASDRFDRTGFGKTISLSPILRRLI